MTWKAVSSWANRILRRKPEKRKTDHLMLSAEKYERIVKTDDPSVCPRCGSTDVAWCGGDMDGQGGYYDMYLCEDCGRRPEGVRVFLVPISKEDYEIRNSGWESNSCAYREYSTDREEVESGHD